MTAFTLALWIAGWRIGEAFPTGDVLAAASGAAFMTVVIAQSANGFACRSTRRPAWRIGVLTNRFLVVAILIELAFAVAMMVVPAAADLLDQRWPPAATWIVIVASAPAVLVADAAWKHVTRRGREPTPVAATAAAASAG